MEMITTHKDLGILFDECLKFHDDTTEVYNCKGEQSTGNG